MKPKSQIKDKLLNEILPVCQDFSGNYKEEGIWRINLAGMRKHSPIGVNWGYAPFLNRYKTEQKAKQVRQEIYETMKRAILLP